MNKIIIHIIVLSILTMSNVVFGQSFIWTKATTPTPRYYFYYKQIYETVDRNLYAAVWGDPLSTLHASTDHGANWSNLKVPITNNGVTSIISTKENTLLIGTEMYGLFRSTDRGLSWQKVLSYPNRISCFAKDKSGVIYAGTLPGDGGSVYSSIDDGITWRRKGIGLIDEFIHDIKLAANGFIYVATYTGVYISTDNGENWKKTSLIGTVDIRSLLLTPRGRVLAGSYNSGIMYYSDDSGVTWLKAQFDIKGNRIDNICMDNSGDLYAGLTSGLYRSVDDGTSWQRIAFKDSLVSTITLSSQNNLLIGTEDHIYYSNKLTDKSLDNFHLFDLYPNPFNSKAHIRVFARIITPITVSIYNILGQLVHEFSNSFSVAGEHTLTWDAKDRASGVYIVKVSLNDKSVLKKIMLVK